MEQAPCTLSFVRRLATAFLLAFSPFLLAWSAYKDAPSGNWIRWYVPEIQVWMDARGTDDVADDNEFPAIVASEETWNSVTECAHPVFRDMGKSTGFLPGEPSEDTPETARNLIYWWNSESQWKQRHVEKAIALTTLYYDVGTGIIKKFDVELADWAYFFTVDTANAVTDVQNTITHELGHALGLDHSKDPEATMYFMAPSGDITKRDLAPDDIEGLCTVYAPVPATDEAVAAEEAAAEVCCPWVVDAPEPHHESGSGCASGAPSNSVLLLFFVVLAGRTVRRGGIWSPRPTQGFHATR